MKNYLCFQIWLFDLFAHIVLLIYFLPQLGIAILISDRIKALPIDFEWLLRLSIIIV